MDVWYAENSGNAWRKGLQDELLELLLRFTTQRVAHRRQQCLFYDQESSQNCVPSVTICTRRKTYISYYSVSCSSLDSEKDLGKWIWSPKAGPYVWSSGARNLGNRMCVHFNFYIRVYSLRGSIWTQKAHYQKRWDVLSVAVSLAILFETCCLNVQWD